MKNSQKSFIAFLLISNLEATYYRERNLQQTVSQRVSNLKSDVKDLFLQYKNPDEMLQSYTQTKEFQAFSENNKTAFEMAYKAHELDDVLLLSMLKSSQKVKEILVENAKGHLYNVTNTIQDEEKAEQARKLIGLIDNIYATNSDIEKLDGFDLFAHLLQSTPPVFTQAQKAEPNFYNVARMEIVRGYMNFAALYFWEEPIPFYGYGFGVSSLIRIAFGVGLISAVSYLSSQAGGQSSKLDSFSPNNSFTNISLGNVSLTTNTSLTNQSLASASFNFFSKEVCALLEGNCTLAAQAVANASQSLINCTNLGALTAAQAICCSLNRCFDYAANVCESNSRELPCGKVAEAVSSCVEFEYSCNLNQTRTLQTTKNYQTASVSSAKASQLSKFYLEASYAATFNESAFNRSRKLIKDEYSYLLDFQKSINGSILNAQQIWSNLSQAVTAFQNYADINKPNVRQFASEQVVNVDLNTALDVLMNKVWSVGCLSLMCQYDPPIGMDHTLYIMYIDSIFLDNYIGIYQTQNLFSNLRAANISMANSTKAMISRNYAGYYSPNYVVYLLYFVENIKDISFNTSAMLEAFKISSTEENVDKKSQELIINESFYLYFANLQAQKVTDTLSNFTSSGEDNVTLFSQLLNKSIQEFFDIKVEMTRRLCLIIANEIDIIFGNSTRDYMRSELLQAVSGYNAIASVNATNVTTNVTTNSTTKVTTNVTANNATNVTTNQTLS